MTPLPLPTFTSSTTWITSLPLAQDTASVFLGETIPDGTNFQPGQTFQKTWTLKNNGGRPWVKGFTLVKTTSNPAGENLGSPEEIPLAHEVEPGENIQISVDLIAPQQDGRYTVYYQLEDETGALVPYSQVWVVITVGVASSTASEVIGNISAEFLEASLQIGEYGEYGIFFCMQLSDSRAWFPENVTLVFNQQLVRASGARSDPATALTDNKCFTFYFQSNGIEPSGSIQLSISKVALDPVQHKDENCAHAQTTLRAAYPGMDFECAGPGNFYTHLVLPSGMTEEQADTLILDAMSSAIYGPWVLNWIAP
ncbi:MAG TPA: hypothetical protein DCK95_02135 [Anaerolineaceae bacterium]|nr:hypothetical protein [Anaerolineaceae bacterium]